MYNAQVRAAAAQTGGSDGTALTEPHRRAAIIGTNRAAARHLWEARYQKKKNE